MNFFVFVIVKEFERDGKKGEQGDEGVLRFYVGVKDFIGLFLLDWMQWGLKENKFVYMIVIQRVVIFYVFCGYDVLGVVKMGSGKMLVFLLLV